MLDEIIQILGCQTDDQQKAENIARPGQLFRPVRSHQQAFGSTLQPRPIHYMIPLAHYAWT